jgi:hypothetical protein
MLGVTLGRSSVKLRVARARKLVSGSREQRFGHGPGCKAHERSDPYDATLADLVTGRSPVTVADGVLL